ncbi:MAG TPA: ATP-binding protein [Chitinophagaceae bacterium]|nr:ATP-binding protein [Chitinophagaceae bacterium]
MNSVQEQQMIDTGLLPLELQYLDKLIRFRLGRYFEEDNAPEEPDMPDLQQWQLPVKDFIRNNSLSKLEALALLIAIVPHIQPDLFDAAIDSTLRGSGDFPKIGGVRGKNFRGFMPTGQTFLFLAGADNWKDSQEAQEIFWSSRVLGKKKVLWLEELQPGEPLMSGRIIVSQDYIETFTFGKPVPPHFSMTFPAKLITTQLGWNDLVINDELREQVTELLDWVKYNDQLMYNWGMSKRLVKGYRALFYGPPGTGKTFTAGLIAREMNKHLYKIDLSMVVSKYIGETEKNLELLFARAEDKGWILFFDEADALFGKRTNVRDAHDKYANQEVSYLLQRIEDFNGLIILCTNMKNNMDDAFIRRFNCIMKFPLPSPDERTRIWRNAFPENRIFCRRPELVYNAGGMSVERIEEVDIPEMVKKYELSGGSIMNVVHYAGLKAVERWSNQGEKAIIMNTQGHQEQPRLPIYLSDVLDGIRREFIKEGKPFIA